MSMKTCPDAPPAERLTLRLPHRTKSKTNPTSGHKKTPETPVFREFWLEVTPGFESPWGDFTSC